jgi:hypothetical protein
MFSAAPNISGLQSCASSYIPKPDWKGFQSLAANISVKLVPTTYLVSQIPICNMVAQILALKKAIGISNTNWYFKYQLVYKLLFEVTRGSALQISANHVFQKNSENLPWNFFPIFFWFLTFRSQFGVRLRNFWGSRHAGLGGPLNMSNDPPRRRRRTTTKWILEPR